jgi:hypothetical protein
MLRETQALKGARQFDPASINVREIRDMPKFGACFDDHVRT